ncbi:glutathione S-transferase family protein [Photobacterium leiognathi]|uniref:glutathione S-transferase family protein n=1 Tax=Photobacterium leiognathi TaxID=553611 RepID=UPI001EDF45EE|nr:glutathione S-transferase family protein [Photobacterium leiognathi]MCG3886111.1 glutathione S-transferase family protein [Photobacterium leiognathi]
MLKIVSFTICPFVQRVTAALEAKNIPYEIEYISLKNKPQWFLDISPNGQVPVLITENNTALFESDAIIEFIEDEYDPLEQDLNNEQRALDRAWSYLAAKSYLPQCGTMGSKDKDTFIQREENLRKAFTKAENQLSGNTLFFKSDTISRVDIAWLPLLHRAAIIKNHTGYDLLCCLPKLQTWQSTLLKTGLAEKSVAPDFIDKFTGFYLTNTYLAGCKDQQCECQSSDCCA